MGKFEYESILDNIRILLLIIKYVNGIGVV